jgi:SAM-dependent methyltransferase
MNPMQRLMNPEMRSYYDRRAGEYDDWWLGTGLFAERARPGWAAEVEQLVELVEALPPARTLDIGCGTGFLTRHLPGEVVGLDQSARMLEVARHTRFFSGRGLARELGGGAVLHDGDWFVVVRS